MQLKEMIMGPQEALSQLSAISGDDLKAMIKSVCAAPPPSPFLYFPNKVVPALSAVFSISRIVGAHPGVNATTEVPFCASEQNVM